MSANFYEMGSGLVKTIVQTREEAKIVIESLKDTSIDLASRWKVFELIVRGGVMDNNHGWGDGFVDSPYDYLYIDRGQTMNFADAYDVLVDNERMEDLDTWREKVLASGYSSFTYDW